MGPAALIAASLKFIGAVESTQRKIFGAPISGASGTILAR
jgi:hypothetical protein